eukprot:3551448-Pleurochrysis_carterae.AAC.2
MKVREREKGEKKARDVAQQTTRDHMASCQQASSLNCHPRTSASLDRPNEHGVRAAATIRRTARWPLRGERPANRGGRRSAAPAAQSGSSACRP